ncbi:follicle cell protein 3C-1-like isoform X1 [Bombus pyrosoma]|uniref:follicle cell protein 3C-1-like isoform X1 n=1 Tax=Bombus pyrosoma TaxID=396416 RepID=UPI001CB9018D|nr:follicle cell protein 3C-1-like isoform X1 [Bombus pyrosoma]
MKYCHSIVRLFRTIQLSLYRLRPTKHRGTAMDRFLLFVLLFIVLRFTMQEVVEEGGCKCAVFSRQISKPIIERALLYNVTCDSEGQEKCQQLCVALAESARDQAPQMICEKLGTHVENLHVAVYAKVCDATSWKFTGLKAADPICCHEGKSTACEEPLPVIES